MAGLVQAPICATSWLQTLPARHPSTLPTTPHFTPAQQGQKPSMRKLLYGTEHALDAFDTKIRLTWCTATTATHDYAEIENDKKRIHTCCEHQPPAASRSGCRPSTQHTAHSRRNTSRVTRAAMRTNSNTITNTFHSPEHASSACSTNSATGIAHRFCRRARPNRAGGREPIPVQSSSAQRGTGWVRACRYLLRLDAALRDVGPTY